MSQTPSSLRDLEHHSAFVERHIGPNDAEIAQMLGVVGHDSLDAMTDAIVPSNIKSPAALALPDAITEEEALARIRAIASKNQVQRTFIGQGYYGTHTPKVILRNILENPAWYTAYTPYQAEISQGRMEALINFQTMCADLTGMQIANASLLDEATAAAEAMTLAKRSAKSKSDTFFVHDAVHPQTQELLRTRAEPLGIVLRVGTPDEAMQAECFGVLLQYPDSFGHIGDHAALADAVHAQGGLVAVATDLLALTLIAAPGEWGADIVVGNSQRFGVPFGFGGPHAAFMACRDAYKRSMPGRLIGVSIDAAGNPAYRLTLQTREQHIRREKATSNICTAQVLLAVMASMYAVYHGPEGLTRIARRTHRLAAILAAALRSAGVTVGEHFFDTLHVKAIDADAIHAKAHAAGINLRAIDSEAVGISLDETSTRADVVALAQLFGAQADIDALDAATADALPQGMRRTSAFLQHPVFNTHHSEHELLRYMRSLADKDLAMDRTMIPLGSCTMKLNATAEMIPVTWPEFGAIHPLAPPEQSAGYAQLIEELEAMLVECTGYDAVSLQPNSGAQGEYAGLLAIRAYHRSRNEAHRDICLIPESAHGTNPASAQMCGMTVVVTKCDANGNVDVDDIRAKAEKYSDRLAALMITYPSTHGVFEEDVVAICEAVHAHGGQVYTDGANMNALVGVAKPGKWGSDVSHLNLHKTFCIPHGGGGPGVGPCAVKSHLAPFLPKTLPNAGIRAGENQKAAIHGSGSNFGEGEVGMVSAASYGSASILPISWMYVTMMGSAGLRKATQVALLNANYIAKRLSAHYKTLYTGRNGLVAHECILDVRPLEKTSGIGAEDIAKRLIDFGFHAPTLSFPVAGTLMVEPTESESQHELDRFIDAMIQIREEIRAIEDGRLDREDNPLKHAPHTATQVSASEWTHAYPRELAAFPLPSLKQQKYWPPVGRVDNVYGDKNVMCACIPVDAYKDDVVA
ncbi:aminomethyl-transferring glycine dehydrogenase [Xanthomonas campestris pv. campestris]|uniref:Glycine dehydrogenase (decarboxylating) n=2 Tax=Xanthomonas campestris pv. campestris TaxID=340 RepID=GCSP_XANCP|nr:aminomethyl-transferring glycine dehydrogenase [Xanthomonas campestris]Q4URZ4.1 RecName: Full=Glycine dehydrogenase (decarboxylating); AltName: Full=Glycine cleavage system P-protein; AltName: Full=Glycine decarboxylase; AltName: Full=Glycine dehydrogenase (aminomethyl-transferring) [Xanthomonas campestris pv. campestris str. 8004]Q8PBK7.1 RecName: Full=Glycine dehydrogenase (decarboxylating); AltName: Full=Glycine cleavage system P-protein; AltName: Full=Glycine decarboxylase; AltName: Full=G